MTTTSYAASGYLTVREAADYTGFSTDSLRRRIANGSLTAAHMGRALRIDIKDLDAWLESLKQKVAS